MAPDDAPFSPEHSSMTIIPLRHKLAELCQFEWYYHYRPADSKV